MPLSSVMKSPAKISDLIHNPKNPRKITDNKLAQLKKALLEFGDLSGIVFNRKTGQLVGGHQRSKHFDVDSKITVTKRYSKPTKTGTVAEGYVLLDGEKFTYREVSWDTHREMAANLAANKQAGEWSAPELTEWLKELSSFDVDFDLDLTMFDHDELSEFGGIPVAAHIRTGATGVDEDEVPEKAPPRTNLGDVYQLGNHRLMCGDSTETGQVVKLMAGGKADLCFTSPPYNVGKNGVMGGKKVGKKYQTNSDDLSEADYFIFLRQSLDICLDASTEVFYNVQFLGANKRVLIDLLHHYKSRVKDLIYWVKENASPHIEPGVMASFVEWVVCLSSSNSSKKFVNSEAPRGSLKNKITGPANARNEFAGVHSAAFPVYLPEQVIESFSKIGMSVLDPFGGTGTTLIACEKTNRRCFMMEIDPAYCDVIVERWEKYTGKKAKLLSQAPKLKLRKKPVEQSINSRA